MLRFTVYLLVLGVVCLVKAQTTVEKSIEVPSGKTISMNFEWPELITVRGWDKNEVRAVASVRINHGANDDAFELNLTEKDEIQLTSAIPNHKQLPERIVVRYNGDDYFFDTDDRYAAEIEKFKKEKGVEGFEYIQHGVIKDITIEVFVPRNSKIDVEARYGMIELRDFRGAASIRSRYGGVDAALSNSSSTRLEVNTKFGELYSNLDTDFSGDAFDIARWSKVVGNLGSGDTKLSIRSEFGNVYLRKAN